MSDILDGNVITDVIDTGITTAPVDSSPTEEFGVGSVSVGDYVEPSSDASESSSVDVIGVSSPSPVVSRSPVAAASDDMTSLDNLRAVSAMFDGGCKTLSDLVKGTGLDQSVVLACVKWLKDNGLMAVTGSFYCTIDNVSTLQSQLKMCQKCFGSK